MLFGILAGGSWALAAPKPVAILNLSRAPESTTASAALRAQVQMSSDLVPLSPGDLTRVLEAPVPQESPEERKLAAATEALRRSRAALAEFKLNEAQMRAKDARAILFELPPSSLPWAERVADLSFQMGLIHLREQNTGLAMRELSLVHKLVKRGPLDPVRYPPQVTRAFTEARSPSSFRSKIALSSTYDGARVFLNGKEVGTAPYRADLPSGVHLFSVQAPGYKPASRLVILDPNAEIEVQMELVPYTSLEKARSIQYAASLETGISGDKLRAAGDQSALLTGAEWVLVIVPSSSGEEKEHLVYLYHPPTQSLTFSASTEGKSLASLLAIATPVGRPELFASTPSGQGRPWYLKPWGIGALAGTAALVASVIVVSTSSEPAGNRLLQPSFFD